MLTIPSIIDVRHWYASSFLSTCTLLFVLDVIFVDGIFGFLNFLLTDYRSASNVLRFRLTLFRLIVMKLITLSSPEYCPTTITCLAL